jgi:hypothetical protein
MDGMSRALGYGTAVTHRTHLFQKALRVFVRFLGGVIVLLAVNDIAIAIGWTDKQWSQELLRRMGVFQDAERQTTAFAWLKWMLLLTIAIYFTAYGTIATLAPAKMQALTWQYYERLFGVLPDRDAPAQKMIVYWVRGIACLLGGLWIFFHLGHR